MALPRSMKFPPVFSSDGDVEIVVDGEDVAQNLRFQTLTTYHEILMTEDGSDMKMRVPFEQNDDIIQIVMKDVIRQVTVRSLPDVEITGVNFTFNQDDS